MTNTKDFDWRRELLDRKSRLMNSVDANRSSQYKYGYWDGCNDVYHEAVQALESQRQQLLKAVEEMGKDPKSTWEDDRGYNQALDDVLDLLKAKDYMEGL